MFLLSLILVHILVLGYILVHIHGTAGAYQDTVLRERSMGPAMDRQCSRLVVKLIVW